MRWGGRAWAETAGSELGFVRMARKGTGHAQEVVTRCSASAAHNQPSRGSFILFSAFCLLDFMTGLLDLPVVQELD